MIRSILEDSQSNKADNQAAEANVRRIVGQVEEESDTLHTAILLEIPGEETGSFHVHTHSSEDDREILLMSIMHVLGGLGDQTGLTTDLSGNLVVWKTCRREDGNLLTSGD